MRRLCVPMLLATLSAGVAQAASFDCRAARTPDERAVCADRALNDQDVRMAQLYGIVPRTVPMGGREVLQRRQAAWLVQRGSCGASRRCIAAAYDQRLAELEHAMRRVYERGPF